MNEADVVDIMIRNKDALGDQFLPKLKLYFNKVFSQASYKNIINPHSVKRIFKDILKSDLKSEQRIELYAEIFTWRNCFVI